MDFEKGKIIKNGNCNLEYINVKKTVGEEIKFKHQAHEMNHELIKYDHAKYNFVGLIKDLFRGAGLKIKSLYTLHYYMNGEQHEIFQVGDDSKTIFHKLFYDKYRTGWPEFQDAYNKLIEEVISPLYHESFLYQSFPTFRVHLPENVAVGAFHNDAAFNHPLGEMNYILPLTFSSETASVWCESEPGKQDFRPFDMFLNKIIKFNGNQLTHGSRINNTGLTRVSFDFRCLPLSLYSPEKVIGTSVTMNTKFLIGKYYSLYEKP